MKKLFAIAILFSSVQTFACQPLVGTWACDYGDDIKTTEVVSINSSGHLQISMTDESGTETLILDGVERSAVIEGMAVTQMATATCNGNTFHGIMTTKGTAVGEDGSQFPMRNVSTVNGVVSGNNFSTSSNSKTYFVMNGSEQLVDESNEPSTCVRQ